MPRKYDPRPICTCSSYKFPHRVGGKCDGSAFAEFHFYNSKSCCGSCNCNSGTHCDVATGQESINEAECYAEAKDSGSSLYLTLTVEDPERPY
jgi:hypothetical protein